MSASSVASPSGIAADDRVVLPCVSWETYERLLADDEERRVPLMTYDRGVLELVTPSMPHEEDALTIGRLVEIVTAILGIPIRSAGHTTFRRTDLERGFEPDASFYIQHEERIRGQREVDLSVDPPPDLVIEMELSRSALNKLALFASMGIPEVWRCDGQQVTISIRDGETYRESSASLAIPALTSEVLTRFLAESRTTLSPDWFRAVSEWARTQRSSSFCSTTARASLDRLTARREQTDSAKGHQVATVASPAEQQIVLHNIAWETYERLLADHIDSSAPRFTYDHGELEILTLSTEHERHNRRLALLVEEVAMELSIEIENVGSMTYKRQDLERGFEADSSFYIQNEPQIRDRTQIDLTVDPPPDLIIEIEVTQPAIARLPIYASMGVPEVWRCDGERVTIHLLVGDDYAAVPASAASPPLTGEMLTRFMLESRSLRRTAWVRQIREWARGQGS